jgi:hypothetical protein
MNRKYFPGTIFKFWERELFVLARVGTNEWNLISLHDGNMKTGTWTGTKSSGLIEIPESTWYRGGPPEIIKIADNSRENSWGWGDHDNVVKDAISIISRMITKKCIGHLNSMVE